MFESIKKFLNRKTYRAYDELINSEAYLNSKYKIRYIDKYNLYAIIDTDLDRYVDIVFFNTYKWRRDSVFFKDCLCTKKESILYYQKIHDVKDRTKITDYEKLDEIDFKSIEKYIRDKKLKNLNKN